MSWLRAVWHALGPRIRVPEEYQTSHGRYAPPATPQPPERPAKILIITRPELPPGEYKIYQDPDTGAWHTR